MNRAAMIVAGIAATAALPHEAGLVASAAILGIAVLTGPPKLRRPIMPLAAVVGAIAIVEWVRLRGSPL